MVNLIVSQCTFPDADFDVTLPLFAELGFKRVEAFTEWAASKLDCRAAPQRYLQRAAAFGLTFHSLHLPALAERGVDDAAALAECLDAVAFAGRMGMSAVYLRSRTEAALRTHARRLLDACEQAGVAAWIEPHEHTPVSNRATARRMLDRIGDDRLKIVLELGHLARAGDDWRDFYETFAGPVNRGGRVASVHLKNMHPDGRWAPWREGVVDVAAVLDRLAADRFAGDLVLECELGEHQATRHDLADLRAHLCRVFPDAVPDTNVIRDPDRAFSSRPV